jgi:hypothetical protein
VAKCVVLHCADNSNACSDVTFLLGLLHNSVHWALGVHCSLDQRSFADAEGCGVRVSCKQDNNRASAHKVSTMLATMTSHRRCLGKSFGRNFAPLWQTWLVDVR